MRSDRLRELVGPAELLLEPFPSLCLLGALALALLPFASSGLGLVLAAFATWLLFMAIRLERPWLAVTPLPPLIVLVLGAWMRAGLGGVVLALGREMQPADTNSPFFSHLPEAQMLWLIFMACAVASFYLFKPSLPDAGSLASSANRQPLVWLVIGCGIFAFLGLVTAIASGTIDRNPDTLRYWIVRLYKPDLLFSAFSRLQNIFFILLPLAFAKAKNTATRYFLAFLFLAFPLVTLPTGGRGNVLYPLAFFVIGLFIAPVSGRIFRAVLALILAFSIVFIPVAESYRDSFSSAGSVNLVERAVLMKNSLAKAGDVASLKGGLTRLGISLYGCSDGFLFQDPSASRSRAGLYGLENVLTFFMPKLLFPDRRPIRDAHIIATEVRGATRGEAETMTYYSFPCITYSGDLYWRGGWSAVVFGSVLFAAAYRALSSMWYRFCGWDKFWRLCLLVYPATFFLAFPAGSIGETVWLWLWDLPKYVILVILIGWLASKFQRHNRLKGN